MCANISHSTESILDTKNVDILGMVDESDWNLKVDYNNVWVLYG